jgi:hypothetical protein
VSHFWKSAGPTGSGKTCAATTLGGNRRERRRQAQAARLRGEGVEDHIMVGSRSAVPDDIKVDINRVVRAIQFTGLDGGTCLFRAALAMSYCDCSGGRRDSVLVVHSIALDLPRCVMW